MDQSKRTVGRWFGTLFALPFAIAGLGMLFFLVVPTLHDWVRMTNWVPVQAELLEARLNITRGKSDTFLPEARYRYRFEGSEHESRRVQIGSRADNIGDFQRDLGRALERSLANGEPVTAWVNPAAPQEAVLDRSLRLPLLFFYMVFVLMFGGFGVGFLWFLWRKSSETVKSPDPDGKPWMLRGEWANNQIRSDRRVEIYVIWGMSIFWNLLSTPIIFLQGPKVLNSPSPGAVISMVFPVVGVALLVWAIRSTREWRQQGDLRLSLDPFPGAIGGHVGGSVNLRTPYEALHRYKVVLSCIEHYYSRSGSDSEWNERLLWQTDGVAQSAWIQGGARLSFRFNVPQDLPASSETRDGERYYGWRVELENEAGTPHLRRRFDIPVYPTAERAQLIRQDSHSEPELRKQRSAAVDALAQIKRDGDSLELYFAPARYAQLALGWLGFGVIFGGSGIGVGMLGAPLIFPIIFCSVGVLLAVCGIWGLGNSLRVWVDRSSLRTERRFMGITVKRMGARREDVRCLSLDVSYRTQQGSRHETIYRVLARLHEGGHIVIADTLRGQPLAEEMLARIARESGLPGL